MNMHPHPLSPRDQLDLLTSRIADGEAGEHDWAAFTGLAEREPGAWKELAQAQREHAALSLAVGVALHGADRVELPGRSHCTRISEPTPHIRTWTRLGAWSGWAAAAAVGLAWFGGFSSRPVPTNTASVVPAGWRIDTPDDAVKAYLDVGARTGRVIGELPGRVVVESQPTTLEGGGQGIEVVYVRRFVERAVVSDLARLGVDESGRRVPVPVSLPAAWSAPD